MCLLYGNTHHLWRGLVPKNEPISDEVSRSNYRTKEQLKYTMGMKAAKFILQKILSIKCPHCMMFLQQIYCKEKKYGEITRGLKETYKILKQYHLGGNKASRWWLFVGEERSCDWDGACGKLWEWFAKLYLLIWVFWGLFVCFSRVSLLQWCTKPNIYFTEFFLYLCYILE